MTVLEVHNLQKTYRQHGKLVEAVCGVSFSINAGEILAFLGHNGAGKTTSIKMIAALIQPDRGWVKIEGCDPHRQPQALQMLGAVLEGTRNLYWQLTAEENLEYFGILRGLSRKVARHRGIYMLDRLGLLHKRRTPIQALSRGMQQKLAIAVALVHHPRLLLLDEPILGLDIEASQEVKTLVREVAAEGCAILLTTHQIEVAEELSDSVAIIQSGKLITLEPTQEIIKRFSNSIYIISIQGELDSVRVNKILALGAIFLDGQISYLGTPKGLYEILEVLNPLPLLQVKQEQADLTQIYIELLRENSHA
ncbi:ABC transporter ATP-binding protein [Dolichospermum sp. ST_sed1]|nr:ABC transporter ATP-binding protein [Dolichospermum sp. ST_sed1]MDD1427770.1 ABC transporter ATP-binding protein [Dolichospermum sp. ST_sed9]MDD1430207.1 ABC transporter ATP-binding protein [Dolichospermum sp. ST_sed6]MDD1443432.1 ABC transporter ATP-binding protein [Dolichospermum sp. ST_sed3]MDD1446680.1 ABC transporter ATP-binding protein [Dolichospermum sp. ST_sed8]MDD1454744.1 ABC transporter ATP-binding protein [Dolichospermum sp. ST_sed7]MDD1463082.1 ABC transporter ATP-binding prot